jgi:predicted acylesterase/phospholipase RssA
MSPDATRTLECDLVMKGGITSGVIYPKLVTLLASRYRLRCIGGTSAGAIAAAAAAAAQHGVNSERNASAFREFERLPEMLGARAGDGDHSMLLNLFQPQPPLARHLALLIAALNAPSGRSLLSRLAWALIKHFPLGAFLGALPGLVLLAQSWGLGWLLSLALVLIGLVAGAAVAALRSLARELPANSFGLCNGMPSGTDSRVLALTPWLHGYLNLLAGKTSEEPLTFGELWGKDPRNPDLQLAMITTALNLGRPYRLPFESGDVYYVREELAAFFPPPVMDWLERHARPSQTAARLTTAGRTFRAFPESAHFPVVIAVRLSLSFPILLSALPLYMVDRTLDINKEAARAATRIYFSDGGISSNFPVHFFDSPLPSRPTFGVNLKDFHPDHPNDGVFLPEMLKNNEGLKNFYPPLSDAPGFGSIASFIGMIVNTMQNWRDSLQLSMPGYRDRIVHVCHSKDEGGLNLNMRENTISALAMRGAQAAHRLIDAFAEGGRPGGPPNAWDNHRRIRARTLLCVLHKALAAIAKAMGASATPSYTDVIVDPQPPSYDSPDAVTAQEGANLLRDLERLAQQLNARDIDLCDRAPKPAPEMRLVPRT